MATAIEKDTIRRDIFSVKVKGNGFDKWCHERMFRSRESARRYKRGLRPIAGYWMEAKIVHPAQWVVEAFVAVGNEIED